MRRHLLFFCLVGVLMPAISAWSQGPASTGGFEPPGKLEIAKHPLILEGPPPPPSRRAPDPVKLHAEANELVELANSVPAEVDQVSQGKLPKDFAEKLKRIEKLSKHLRSELNP
ncbi:MAG: hypothetical protein WAL32_02490 [Terriglobales bacterium]